MTVYVWPFGLLSVGLFLVCARARSRSKKPLMWLTAVLGAVSAVGCLAGASFLATFKVVW